MSSFFCWMIMKLVLHQLCKSLIKCCLTGLAADIFGNYVSDLVLHMDMGRTRFFALFWHPWKSQTWVAFACWMNVAVFWDESLPASHIRLTTLPLTNLLSSIALYLAPTLTSFPVCAEGKTPTQLPFPFFTVVMCSVDLPPSSILQERKKKKRV